MPVLDHVTLRVSDFAASRAFYDAVLAPLGLRAHVVDEPPFAEWGDFSIVITTDGRPVTRDVHVAFAARSRAEVDAFHAAGLAAGATDNGAPGERPQYHPGYYGAFLLDPDGNNAEAVFHDRDAPR
jgi:catechol 2,3-dioxygenase-like lactoylglutathione lyase family enzyme